MKRAALLWLIAFAACEREHPDIFAGSQTHVAGKPAPFADAAYRVQWTGVRAPRSAKRGARIDVAATVTNITPVVWPDRGPGAVALGVSWTSADDPAQTKTYALDRGALPQALRPGQSARLHLSTAAPLTPGRYHLELDLVHENVTWFASKGNTPARSEVIVE